MGVIFCFVEDSRAFQRISYTLFGDLVKKDPFNLLFLAYDIGHMKGNGLAFPVRVRPDEYLIHILADLFQLLHYLCFALHGHKMRGKALLDIHPELAFGKILDVPVCCLYDVILSEKFGKGFHLCW
ncbi:MAG: hypothetical protein A4E58_00018 [Syntrophorhabdus sp. PtaB.Bin006]|nr:MAG: hypothetical protein A4E58_00018 [Syntrophorhabdus sp. PtaB.Bin006]